MKSFLILILALFATGFSHSHNYYFGFAEMQYNEVNRTMETTIVLSAHDLEEILLKKSVIGQSLEYLQKDSTSISAVAKEILKDFNVSLDGKALSFEPFGFEITRNGLINIYLLARNVSPGKALEVSFTCLMDVFPDQQNKLTYIKGTEKLTAVFLPAKKSAVLQIQ